MQRYPIYSCCQFQLCTVFAFKHCLSYPLQYKLNRKSLILLERICYFLCYNQISGSVIILSTLSKNSPTTEVLSNCGAVLIIQLFLIYISMLSDMFSNKIWFCRSCLCIVLILQFVMPAHPSPP